jgi:hypothetical protein
MSIAVSASTELCRAGLEAVVAHAVGATDVTTARTMGDFDHADLRDGGHASARPSRSDLPPSA